MEGRKKGRKEGKKLKREEIHRMKINFINHILDKTLVFST